MRTHEADYLIVGAGAMGMAFADVLLAETDASMVLVDRHDRPGGHWNDAYPFVRLHQPSSFYGVNSRELSTGRTDDRGGNKGLAELATGDEVRTYFARVLDEQLLPSGRVVHLPMHEMVEGACRSLVTGEVVDIDAERVVDCTYMNVAVPSVAGPPYPIEAGMACVAPNHLPDRAAGFERFTVIGGGKTAMDACLWLLDRGLEPDRVTWIRPRDSWLLNRRTIQPGEGGADFLDQFTIAAGATTIDDLFSGLEAAGQLLRFDTEVKPTMYRCATVTEIELDQLRTVRDVVRLGHVRRIAPGEIELDEGTVRTDASTLHVDCTADGLARRPAVPVFGDGVITAQAVRTCQQVFSAAFIAHIEASDRDGDRKNELCAPVPHPDSDIDWLRTTLAQMRNQVMWSQDDELASWLRASRLDPFSRPDGSAFEADDQLVTTAIGAVANLERLLGGVEGD